MFPIYCNKCYKKDEVNATLSFRLSRCHHIICCNCAPKDIKKCPVCDRDLHAVAIAHDMPASAANYLQDPKRFLILYKNISKFQDEQRAMHYQHFYNQQHSLDEKKQKLNGYIKLEAQLQQQIATEKKRIADLRRYIGYYDRKDEAMLNDASFSSNDISSLARKVSLPRTPSFSATDTDVPIDDLGLRRDGCQMELKQKQMQYPVAGTSKGRTPSVKRKMVRKLTNDIDFEFQ